eukprot:1157808-Pelagomonas_calceolata.AAC.5
MGSFLKPHPSEEEQQKAEANQVKLLVGQQSTDAERSLSTQLYFTSCDGTSALRAVPQASA